MNLRIFLLLFLSGVAFARSLPRPTLLEEIQYRRNLRADGGEFDPSHDVPRQSNRQSFARRIESMSDSMLVRPFDDGIIVVTKPDAAQPKSYKTIRNDRRRTKPQPTAIVQLISDEKVSTPDTIPEKKSSNRRIATQRKVAVDSSGVSGENQISIEVTTGQSLAAQLRRTHRGRTASATSSTEKPIITKEPTTVTTRGTSKLRRTQTQQPIASSTFETQPLFESIEFSTVRNSNFSKQTIIIQTSEARKPKKLRYKPNLDELNSNAAVADDNPYRKTTGDASFENEATSTRAPSRNLPASRRTSALRGKIHFSNTTQGTPGGHSSEEEEGDNYPAYFKVTLVPIKQTKPTASPKESLSLRGSQKVTKIAPSNTTEKPTLLTKSPKYNRYRPYKSTTSTPTKSLLPVVEVSTNTPDVIKPRVGFYPKRKSQTNTLEKQSSERVEKTTKLPKFGNNSVRTNHRISSKTTTKADVRSTATTKKPHYSKELYVRKKPLRLVAQTTAKTIIETDLESSYESDTEDSLSHQSSKYHQHIQLPIKQATRRSFLHKEPTTTRNRLQSRSLTVETFTNLPADVQSDSLEVIPATPKTVETNLITTESTETTINDIRPFPIKRARFSSRYKAPLQRQSPVYKPTVPSVTSTTDEEDENAIDPDINIISFSQARSTLSSENLITAETVLMPSLLNVETSHYSPSVTVSIFDALADILTSTPNTVKISSTTEPSTNKDIEIASITEFVAPSTTVDQKPISVQNSLATATDIDTPSSTTIAPTELTTVPVSSTVITSVDSTSDTVNSLQSDILPDSPQFMKTFLTEIINQNMNETQPPHNMNPAQPPPTLNGRSVSSNPSSALIAPTILFDSDDLKNPCLLTPAQLEGLSRQARLLKIIESIVLQNNVEFFKSPDISSRIGESRSLNLDNPSTTSQPSNLLQQTTTEFITNTLTNVDITEVPTTTENPSIDFTTTESITTPEITNFGSTELDSIVPTTTDSIATTTSESSTLATTAAETTTNEPSTSESISIEPSTTETLPTTETFLTTINIEAVIKESNTTPQNEIYTEPYSTTIEEENLDTTTDISTITEEMTTLMMTETTTEVPRVETTTKKAESVTIPKKDYFIFGILSNNTVVRKNPNDNQLESLTEASPYIVFGIMPNNTIVRRFPNGTTVPNITPRIDILEIDPRSLRNPYHPVYTSSAFVRAMSNTNEITDMNATVNMETQVNGPPVNNTEVMTVNIASSVANGVNLTDVPSDEQVTLVDRFSLETSTQMLTTLNTPSHVVSLLTTAKLPAATDILENSIAAAAQQEKDAPTTTTTTEQVLTLDIDPETKKIRTEKQSNGDPLIKFKPLSDFPATTEAVSHIQKLATWRVKTTKVTTLQAMKPKLTVMPMEITGPVYIEPTTQLIDDTTIEPTSESMETTTETPTIQVLETTKQITETTTTTPLTIKTTTTAKPITVNSNYAAVSRTTVSHATTVPTTILTTTTQQTYVPTIPPTKFKTLPENLENSLVNLVQPTFRPRKRPSTTEAPPEIPVTTMKTSTSTFSIEEDVLFLNSLRDLVTPRYEDPETSLANRIIALAVDRNLAEIKDKQKPPSRTPKKVSFPSPIEPTVELTTSAPPINTNSLQNELQLLQTILSNSPETSVQNTGGFPQGSISIDNINPADIDLRLIESLFASPRPSVMPVLAKQLSSTAKPKSVKSGNLRLQDTGERVTSPRLEDATQTIPQSVLDDVSSLADDRKLLQALLQLQGDGGGVSSTPGKLDLGDLSEDKALAALLKSTKKPVVPTKQTLMLSTEFGKTNDALIAAILKEQGIGPTTPGAYEERLKVVELLNQVIVTPKPRPKTTTPPPPTTRQPRPVLDGLAWLWQQWQETSPGQRDTRSRPSSPPQNAIAADGGRNQGYQGERTPLLPPAESIPAGGAGGRNQLVTAAINVTRAFSQFLGAAIQGAAQTVQTVIRLGQRAASDIYATGSG